MNRAEEILLKGARKVVMSLVKNEAQACIQDPSAAHLRIKELLSSPEPCMIARIGSTEMNVVLNYISVKKKPQLKDYLSGKSYQWWWNERGIELLKEYSGFFPLDMGNVERFCELMIDDALKIDLLGSWLDNEDVLCPQLGKNDRTPLRFLEPFWTSDPWTKALEGKKILVVHPFAGLIETQYFTKRDKLFEDKSILPEFSLQTIKAVQSLGGGCDDFGSWFDALKWMEEEIDGKDYDIALIGCGAYGLPLAAHVKRQGKKAFHMGGALQLMFGIKGNRWEDPMYGVKEWGVPEGFYVNLMNENWVKAGAEFRPQNADKVEKACYW